LKLLKIYEFIAISVKVFKKQGQFILSRINAYRCKAIFKLGLAEVTSMIPVKHRVCVVKVEVGPIGQDLLCLFELSP
jgi:hypothetical protein